MRINSKPTPIRTHEGAPAQRLNPEQQLKRAVMACMLWENTFYESGVDIATRIEHLATQCDPCFVARTAIEARLTYKLRHAPLLLLCALVKTHGGKLAEDTIFSTINRPDEMPELLSIYWRDGRRPIPNSMKKGLARAFTKFDEYQLSKWNRDYDVKLRDVMFMVHPRPVNLDQAEVFKKLANGTLSPPDTWESAMASGRNKKEVFEDLLKRYRLGYMALLRNLRGMLQVGVDDRLIRRAIANMKQAHAVLPYRFIAAAKHAPQLEPDLDAAMVGLLECKEKMVGKTVLLVDVSYSMNGQLSSKSDLNRLDAACGLAILLASICEDYQVLTFSYQLANVPPRKGMALRDAIVNSQPMGSTYLGKAMNHVNQHIDYDRVIVFTDEQSADVVPAPKGKGYMINVASYRHGIGYGAWRHIDGFSEACVEFIQEYEREFN